MMKKYSSGAMFKAGFALSKSFVFNESALKVIKNASYYMVKLLFFETYTFLFQLFGYVEERLDEKATFIFMFMYSLI